jgi:NhaP-type Na+/H+ or K+/H+ antiporter
VCGSPPLGVAILSFLLNRRLVKLTFIDQFVMAYGGLRGGIAFCLALSLDEELVPEKRLFQTATMVIVFFTIFVQVCLLSLHGLILIFVLIYELLLRN